MVTPRGERLRRHLERLRRRAARAEAGFLNVVVLRGRYTADVIPDKTLAVRLLRGAAMAPH